MSTLRRPLYILLPICTVILLLLAALSGTPGRAAPEAAGDLDTGFGLGGKQIYQPTDYSSAQATSFAMQPDGKAIVAGYNNTKVALARFNTDGSPDPSFGGDGRVETGYADTFANSVVVAVADDGKIVVAFTDLSANDHDFIALRYNANGSLDAGFGSAGRVKVDFGGAEQATAVTINPDNTIILAGTTASDFVAGHIAVARLSANGSLDPSFGSGGKQTIEIAGLVPNYVVAAATRPDGHILLAGTVSTGKVNNQMAVAQLSAAGALDTTFGVSGAAATNFLAPATVRTLAVAADGKIVLGGEVASHGRDFALARFLPGGALDGSFGSGGLTETDLSGGDIDYVSSILLLPGGGLIACGITLEGGGSERIGLAAYDDAGNLDPNFSGGGKLITHPPVGDVAPLGLAQLPDGKLLVGARVLRAIDFSSGFGVARYAADGTLDTTYGSGGAAVALFNGPTSPAITDEALQQDGKIVVVGAQSISYAHFFLARFERNGAIDTSFGQNGQVITRVGNLIEYAKAIAIAADGKILVAGSGAPTVQSPNNMLVMRYNADGSLDSNFGQNGRAVIVFPSGTTAAGAIALAPDGKIVVAGHIGGATGNLALARLNADGTIDPTFSGDGYALLSLSSGDDQAAQVTVMADGKILLAATRDYAQQPFAAPSGNFALVRINSDGTLDTAFGNGGVSNFTFAQTAAQATKLALLPDGRILVAGLMRIEGAAAQGAVVRANANGLPDASFGSDGRAVVSFDAASADQTYGAVGLAVQSNGKIVLTGGQRSFYVARFNANGSNDVTFGSYGKVSTNFGSGTAIAAAVVIQLNGRIVVAGNIFSTFQNPEYGVALAGYRSGSAEPTNTPTATPVPPSPTPPAGCIFQDVCGSDFFFTPVQYLLAHGAISGYADNTFRPFAATTRSQLVKIVVLAAGLKPVTPQAPTFNDVPTTNPFYSYVETAAAGGFIGGYDDGTFRPFSPVTRGQIAKIVVLAAHETPLTPATPSFSDVLPDNPFFGFIERAKERGYISGYDDGTFRWQNDATRGQIAKIVYAIVQ